ncbi:hypothetical protein C5167_025688 [Papaver somniferum]|uniref:Uncharacterized protein n=1 Tax=Papaver somniferum TaxID=3469 RepID=A0A4Y7JS64_PAPSO|nr:hypothetical protein C5167_025688 [Papaver somniferum]
MILKYRRNPGDNKSIFCDSFYFGSSIQDEIRSIPTSDVNIAKSVSASDEGLASDNPALKTILDAICELPEDEDKMKFLFDMAKEHKVAISSSVVNTCKQTRRVGQAVLSFGNNIDL